MTGKQLKEKMAGDWDDVAEVIALLEKEVQYFRQRVCDQDAALVESAYAVSDAFNTAFNLKKRGE